jgi:hypothetical protein
MAILLKSLLLEMLSEYSDLQIVLTTFEMDPYEILILQDSYGELITIKIFRNG